MITGNRIQRYVFKACLASFCVVLGVISVAILLVDTVEQLRTIGSRADISIGDAFYLALLKFPMLIEQTMPFAVLIGTMMAFRQLSRRAELPVIRASGISAWTFLTPPMVAAALIGMVTTLIVSPLGANLNAKFESIRDTLVDRSSSNITVFESGVWLREVDETGQTIINAASIDDTGTVLSDVKFIVETRVYENGRETDRFVFARRYDAATAQLSDGYWQLEDVIENAPQTPTQRYSQLTLNTPLQVSTMTDQFAAPSSISFWTLPAQIRQSKAAGLNTNKLEMRFMSLTALPLVFVVMSLIGALACLRLARLGGTAPLMIMAGFAAIGLYFAGQVSSGMAITGTVPPVIAAWTPPLLALIICFLIIAYREDG